MDEPTTIQVFVCPRGCRCACAEGGRCEHDWSGPTRAIGDGRGETATCARCGLGAFDHDLMVLP